MDISDQLLALKHSIPIQVLEKHIEINPEMMSAYSEKQTKFYLQDVEFMITYLSEAIALNETALFNDYLQWVKTFFDGLPVADEEIIAVLEILKDTLVSKVPTEHCDVITYYINSGIEFYRTTSPALKSFITDDNPLKSLADAYLDALLKGNKFHAGELILGAVSKGVKIRDIYIYVFEAAQKETGTLWQNHTISVAQEHYITASTQLIMAQLYSRMFTGESNGKKVVVACPQGELHEVGARMVADFFEMNGWDSYYFGANTPSEALVSQIQKIKPRVIALSTTFIPQLKELRGLIKHIRATQGITAKIFVGGYPFLLSPDLWKEIGADNFAPSADVALSLAKNL